MFGVKYNLYIHFWTPLNIKDLKKKTNKLFKSQTKTSYSILEKRSLLHFRVNLDFLPLKTKKCTILLLWDFSDLKVAYQYFRKSNEVPWSKILIMFWELTTPEPKRDFRGLKISSYQKKRCRVSFNICFFIWWNILTSKTPVWIWCYCFSKLIWKHSKNAIWKHFTL